MIAAYLKCVSKKKRRMVFSFLDYLFFFVLEILTFLYYANEESYERNGHHKKNPESHPLCHCHDNGFAAGYASLSLKRKKIIQAGKRHSSFK